MPKSGCEIKASQGSTQSNASASWDAKNALNDTTKTIQLFYL